MNKERIETHIYKSAKTAEQRLEQLSLSNKGVSCSNKTEDCLAVETRTPSLC